jgi:thymidylate synthase
MKYTHEDGTLFTKEEFLQKLKTDKEFNNEFGNKGIDQISELIRLLKETPDSRRMVVNAWAVHDLPNQVLPPCHYGFQVYTRELSLEERITLVNPIPNLFTHEDCDVINLPKRAISLMWNQRSVDTFLGLPFNIASYGLLLEIIAKEVNMVPDELIGNLGDVHIYKNHIEAVNTQLFRTLSNKERYNRWFNNNYETGMEYNFDENALPDFDNEYYTPTPTFVRRESYTLPTLNIKLHFNNEPSFTPEYWLVDDFELENYQSHPTIKAPLSN